MVGGLLWTEVEVGEVRGHQVPQNGQVGRKRKKRRGERPHLS